MIDFIKIYVFDKGVIDRITNLDFIHKVNYSQWVNFKTGQIFITHKFDLDGILFYWDDYKLTIVLKPHYYFNENIHNANDFTTSKSLETLTGIIQRLELENALEHLKIVGIEYGVNFVIDAIDTEVVNAICYHSTNQFYNIKDLPYCKVSYQTSKSGKANQHKQYKFYAKAIQHPTHCKPNTLRAEIRSNRSKYINKLGIYTVADLLNLETYQTFKDHLTKETEQLFFTQELKKTRSLTPHQRATLKKMNSPFYWQKVLKNQRSKFTRKKAQYFTLLDKTGYNLTKIVITGIKDKLNELFTEKCGLTSRPLKTVKSGLTSYNSILRHCTTFKTCLVTGENITMQNRDSFLLSNTGLKKLEQTNPTRFKELVNNYITGNHNKYETTIYSQLSKQIRNEYFNRQHQQKRLYPVEQTNLFNISA